MISFYDVNFLFLNWCLCEVISATAFLYVWWFLKDRSRI